MPNKCPRCLAPDPELNNDKQVYLCSMCGKTWPLDNPEPHLSAQEKAGPTRIFLSYARDDDEPFVHRLRKDLLKAGFKVWLDRYSLRSRGKPFPQEIKDAIRTETDRLIYIGGPKALVSDYVQAEWKFALECDHVVVIPIVRLGDYDGSSIPGELSLLHCEDFREEDKYKDTLLRLIDNLKQPNPPLGGLLSVPSLPPGFISRPELMRRVRDALLVDLQKPQVITGDETRFGIQGMGGIGKSVLAAALARNREIRQTYPNGIVWVSFAQDLKNEDLLSRQREVISYLGGDTTYDTLSLGRERLRLLLQDKALLLILDDVWQAKDVAQTFDVMGPRCRLLITTRDAGILQALKGEPLPVSLFSEAEALQLLSTINNLAVKDLLPEAAEVAKECGYLPLALALCAAMAKKQGGDFSAVLTRLRRADLDKIEDRAAINEQHRNIWRAMQVSVEMLNPEKQKRFGELAAFYPDRPISEAVVVTLWAYTAELDDLDSKDLLIELVERSLVQRSEMGAASVNLKQSFNLHDLLYDYATVMAQDRQALNKTLVEAYRKKTGNRFYEGPNDGYFFENLCHHLIDLKDWTALIGDKDGPGPLTDLRFIQAKCEAGLVYDLVNDYNMALAELPEFREEQVYLREHKTAMRAYNQALNDYAVKRYDYLKLRDKGEACIDPLYPEMPAILSDEKRPPFPEENSERAARLRHFANFVFGHSGPLRQNPKLTMQLAYNSSDESPVNTDSSDLVRTLGFPLLLRSPIPAMSYFRPQYLCTLEGHINSVTCVCITLDGKRAVSASEDKTLCLWDLETGECLRKLEGHSESVSCVSVTQDGKRAVSGGVDNTLRIWDLETGECLRKLEGHRDWILSVSVTQDGKWAVSGSKDNTLRIWDLETGNCLSTLEGHNRAVFSVSVIPDGKRAVSGSWDKTLRIWDLETGNCLRKLEGHSESVTNVSVTPDGKRAVSGSFDNTLRIWDLETGNCLRTLEGHNSAVFGVSIILNGKQAVSGSGDNTLCLWDLESGNCLRALKAHSGLIMSVSVTLDGNRVVSASEDKTLCLWDLETGEYLRTPEGHSSKVTSLSVASDGNRAISGSWDKTLRLWDLETGECLRTLNVHDLVTCVSITPDGKRVILGSWDKALRLLNLQTGDCLHMLEGHSDWILSVSMTQDGKRAVSGSKDNTLRIWDLETGNCLHTLQGHNSWIESVSVTPDGKRAVSGSSDKTLRLWDLETGECLHTLQGHSDDVNSVSVTPDGKRAVSGSSDKTLQIWSLESGECLAVYHAFDGIYSEGISPLNNRIICGTSKGEIHFLKMINQSSPSLGNTTAVRLWLFGDDKAPGCWDDNLTALCPWCGKRFTVSNDMAGKQSTCPFQACARPIQINPFIVDGRG